MLTICFDDGYLSTYENAYPVLERYGFKGTVSAVPSLIGQPGYMTWEQLTFLYDQGWEIGSHTYTHPHLTALTRPEIEQELSLSKQTLERHGFQVFSFASPYGEWNDEVIEVIKEYYLLHRTSWPFGLNDIPVPEDQRYYLRAVAADEITIDEVKEWISRAKEENKWLILIFHRVDEDVPQYNVTSQQLDEILRYAHELGFRGVAFNDLFTAP